MPHRPKNELFKAIYSGKRQPISYFLDMDKKISLDLAKHHYYIQIESSAHTPIFSSVFAIDFLIQFLSKQAAINLYGYCFFPNKLHLLVLSQDKPSTWLEPCLVQYNQWHQQVNNESGYLFDDEKIKQILIQPKYLNKALRHIHNLPVTNKLCSTCDQYSYSSYHDYIGQQSTHVSTSTILAMLSHHSGQRNRRFQDYMASHKPEKAQQFDNGSHDYYLAYADSNYLTRAMSQYNQPYQVDVEQSCLTSWQKCLTVLSQVTQLEHNTLLGVTRHHNLPEAHYLLAWLFVNVAKGPLYFAAKNLSIDETTLQLNIKSIVLHHPKAYLRYIADSWQQSLATA